MVVLAGSAVGRLLAYTPLQASALRWAGPAAVLALIVSLVPYGRHNEQIASAEITKQQTDARQLSRLHSVIVRDGGSARIRACGQPVTLVGFQSTLAWELGMNVGDVGFRPGRSIRRGTPIVVFKPHLLGWQVHPFNIPRADAGRCDRLKTDSAFG
jgi:hypothetical protein